MFSAPATSSRPPASQDPQEGKPDAAPAREPDAGPEWESDAAPAREPDAPALLQRCNVLLLTFLTVFVIGFGVWLFFAGTRYRDEHAQASQGWHVGTARMLEITLVKDDRTGLSCASDQVIDGLRCGHTSDFRSVGPEPANDPQVLQPYNTTKNELFLGAGLWNSPDLRGALPARRFSVVCNYNMKGIMKSGSIRFVGSAPFNPLQKTVMVGTLTDCVIPR